MTHKLLVSVLLLAFLTISNPSLATSSFFDFKKDKEIPVAAPLAEKMTNTIKKLPEIATHLHEIVLINGIRAMDGEIATEGEVKILVNLDWQNLDSKPTQRKALDNTAARIITAVFSEHQNITKLRVIVKILNNKGKYQSAAKVFSFTRATWELTKNNPRYDLNTETGAANLLALGDYVILTDKGWTRGY